MIASILHIKPTTALVLSILVHLALGTTVTAEDKKPSKPNFIIILTDDQGYGDLGCFGSEKIKTPHIDRMAKEGCKFTSFMVGASVCTPSRAALLTGCYPKTVGLHTGVLFPDSTTGLHPDEHTIADHLKAQGYATACFGKWHLGHHPETLPTRQGFDEFYGIPYSNDMNHKNAYTNVIEHLDAETGRLLDTLRDTGLDQNTYVIFTSDNGPWIWLAHHAGSAGPLRGLKGETWEGGMRVPCVMWAPGRIPAGTECDQLATTLDLLPTIASLTDSKLPEVRKIDGVDISSLLADSTTESPRKEFLYYHKKGHVEGLRQGEWKLLKPQIQLKKGEPLVEVYKLFDLSKDIGEENDIHEEHPELVNRLLQRMDDIDAEIEKNARNSWKEDQ